MEISYPSNIRLFLLPHRNCEFVCSSLKQPVTRILSVIPHVQVPPPPRWYLQPAELLEILMTNLIGHSSRLYEWDNTTEKFQPSLSLSSKVIVAYGFSEEFSKECVNPSVTLHRPDPYSSASSDGILESVHA